MKNERELTVYGFKSRWDDYPSEIRIKGKWLKELGFDVGVKYRVECQEGRLILSAITEPEAKA